MLGYFSFSSNSFFLKNLQGKLVLGPFPSYKEMFVISNHSSRVDSSQRLICSVLLTTLAVTGTLNNFWWGYTPSYPALSRVGRRRFFSASRGLYRALRISRLYLLHFGHRRVCSRASLWAVDVFWSLCYFSPQKQWFQPLQVSDNQYSYRHLHLSLFIPAGILLTQPNFYLFIYLLSNPYFWLVLQQSLNSVYRS